MQARRLGADGPELSVAGLGCNNFGMKLGQRRDDVVIATKFLPRPKDEAYTPGALRKRITEACEESLRRLRTDRIDLYYQHYPDTDASAEEALETLDELVRQGKVLHIASSNVNAEQVKQSATRSATSYPPPARPGSASCRTSRWPAGCSPASTQGSKR